ncbi:MAG: phosphate signaling complex protein PhoU [Sterolibacterium sp.]|jgi:phosphate transport system protein|nr:phosphate signaling complex protein PhoU [Sterolibacterium sp.]
MNENQHLSSRFDAELDHLRTQVLHMGGMVETQVAAALEAYDAGSPVSVNEIVMGDRAINALEKIIDDDCAHLIARRQPTASDLRLVLGVSKMVTDLERIGDEAKKVAKAVRRIHSGGHHPTQSSVNVRHLAEAALLLVREALDAFARLDTSLAHEVIKADGNVDIEFKAIIRQLITHMMEDPRAIGVSIEILSIARAIERIGDHAKNVAEQVVYIVDGRDIRHLKEHSA